MKKRYLKLTDKKTGKITLFDEWQNKEFNWQPSYKKLVKKKYKF